VSRFLTAVAALAAALACSSKGSPARPADAGAPAGKGAPAHVYVAKVKNLLVGLPPTDDEVKLVAREPGRLGPLIDQWMARPEYGRKLQRFFALAFQQTQINANDFADQVFAVIGRNDATTPLILQNVQESFARTMVELTARDRPLTEAFTTRQLMMTTALKELYGFLDTIEVDNQGAFRDRFRETPRKAIIVGAASGPIPIEETLDPSHANYMRWYNPDVATEETNPECQQDPVSLPPSSHALHFLLLGSIEGRRLVDGKFCVGFHGTAKGPQFKAADFEDWTMVTLRPPRPGEATTTFYDLPALRRARELVIAGPRLGFFSTPAFFANWQTNTSNQMRVTVNQALIVATGASIDTAGITDPPGAPGLDRVHSQGACVGCHLSLDPTRSIFSSTWSWNYHTQADATWAAEPGMFAFGGVVAPVQTIDDFAQQLVKHPLVARGWTQKLCHYANSAPCDENDPEFARIVALFARSGHSWRTLVKALLSSRLVTYAADAQGEVVAVSRRDHFCAGLGARLGLPDVCGLSPGSGNTTVVPRIASGLPSDAYGRGAVAPILPNEPTLFFVAGLENICKEVAAIVVDGPPRATGAAWSSAQPEAAIADFVATVMGLVPSDPRAAPARALLDGHFREALGTPGVTAAQALQSTFVVSCLAPSAISVGL
jgi:hypothetical protein